MMAQGVYRIPKISLRVRDRADQHDADGRVPRRRAGPRRRRCSNASSTSRRPSSASIRSRCGAATSCSPTSSRTRPSCAPCTTAATTTARSPRRCGSRATTSCAREQAERRARGDRTLLGIGVSAYVEITAGGGGGEYGSVTVNDDGTATIRVGTSSHGQGHATSFAMIVADRLQHSVRTTCGSSSPTRPRFRRVAGPAARVRCSSAARAVLERGRRGGGAGAARSRRRCSKPTPTTSCVTDDGRVGVAGVPASALTWAQLARA